MSDRPSSFRRGSFLSGEPRVHYNDLEYIENADYEARLYYNGSLFSGVAWQELEGYLREDSIVNGLRHGRCVEFYANGQMAKDGSYEEDCPVGEHTEWYESGVTKLYEVHDNQTFGGLRRDYNESGQLIREYDSRHQRHRFWYSDGNLLYDSVNDVATCYAPDGKEVFCEAEDGEIEFCDEVLFKHAKNMFSIENDFVKHPLFQWLHRQLDKEAEAGKQLLFDLTNHINDDIAETALQIIGDRSYQDAIPLVRSHTKSKRRKPDGAAGYIGTFAELAQTTLVKLTIPKHRQEAELQKLERRMRARIEAEEKNTEDRRKRELKNYPSTTARFVMTQCWETTLMSGDQVLTDEFNHRSYEYHHVYEYSVDGATYRAKVVTQSQITPSKIVTVRYDERDPSVYVVEDLGVDSY